MQAKTQSAGESQRRRRMRAGVAAAFQRKARGVPAKAAYAATVEFYRSSGQPWARALG